MQSTMNAWVLTAPKKLERTSNEPMPVMREDQILVRITASCICNGSDPGIFNGHEGYPTPLIFGHEASGVVVRVGKQVQGIQAGQKVCWWFEAGAFAEYVAVTPEKVALFPVPASLTEMEAPIMELVFAACRALMDVPAADGRKRLTICGMGPSGQVLLQYARLLGYTTITCWDLYPQRRELAKSLGADAVLDPRQLSSEEVEALEHCDVAVDMMSDDLLPGQPTATLLMRHIRKGGLYVSYGHPPHGRTFDPYVFQSRDLVMQGPTNDIKNIRDKARNILQWVEQGKIQITPLISHVIDFEELGAVFADLLENPDRYMKVIVRPVSSEQYAG